MKKLVLLFVSFLLIFASFSGITAYAADDIMIFVDGEELITDTPPAIINDRTMIPLRAVAEAVGCRVEWFADDQRVEVYLPADGGSLIMHINDPKVILNLSNGETGETITSEESIDSPPVIVNARTLVPLRFIAETIGFEVEWDADTRTVYLKSGIDNGETALQLTIDTSGLEQADESGYLLDSVVFIQLESLPYIAEWYTEETLTAQLKELEGEDIRLTSLSESAEQASRLTYPVWRAVYETGSNEDTARCIDLFIGTDAAVYRVHTSVPVDYETEYSDEIELILKSVELSD